MKPWKIALLMGIFAVSSCKTGGSDGGSASTVRAQGEGNERPAQLYRFDPWMEDLRASIETPDATVDSVATQVVEGSARIASYNLQGLCRIYGDEDDLFGKLRDDFKAMEDAIGQYDKYEKVLKKAKKKGKSPDVIAKLEGKLASAFESIKELLVERKWVRDDGGETRLQKIQRHLDEYDWRKYKKDRERVLKYLIGEIKDIEDTKYKFKRLEEGNGLHELRRDIRWVSIEMRVLNGLVTFEKEPEKCPIPDYAHLIDDPIAESRYADLPPSATEPDACKIPKCLYLGMAQMIEEFGEIKDDAEAEVNSQGGDEVSDDVPKKYRERAEELYAKLIGTRLLDEVKDELKKCID